MRALFLPHNLRLPLHVAEVVLLCLLALDILLRFRRGSRPPGWCCAPRPAT
ncbi:MAG: hypothetical protein GY856_53690 [bacterium]|nr:hypothetical protein [bacterium]